MKQLMEAARMALKSSMNLRSEESFLVITDENKLNIGQALFEVGKSIARESLLVVMQPAKLNGQEPPEPLAKLMMEYDVIICPTTKSITHTDARRNACKSGSRVATMPGITEDCMIRTLNADYSLIADRTYKVSEILDRGSQATIETKLGTKLTMPINGIKAISSTGLIRDAGMGGNLPSGESFLMPVEGTSEGVVYIDGSLAGIGKIESGPVKVTISDGYAEKIEGGPEAEELSRQLSSFGKAGLNLAELGIGTNHEARITGQILEDEKVMGTVHVAFGNNVSMGGTHNVGIHIDGVLTDPTLYIDDILLLDNGELIV